MSWKPAWKVHGEGDKWCTNAQAFATYTEALCSAGARFGRWTMATDYTALESDEAVNYRHVDHVDQHLMEVNVANDDRDGTASPPAASGDLPDGGKPET